mgnify:FL=1
MPISFKQRSENILICSMIIAFTPNNLLGHIKYSYNTPIFPSLNSIKAIKKKNSIHRSMKKTIVLEPPDFYLINRLLTLITKEFQINVKKKNTRVKLF